jgi:hypothetical protein
METVNIISTQYKTVQYKFILWLNYFPDVWGVKRLLTLV